MEAAFKTAKAELEVKPSETKPKTVKPPVTKPDPKPAQTTEGEAEEKAKAAEEKPLQAPERWTQDRKELFSKQPPEIQKAWLGQNKDWETGYGKKFEEISTIKKDYEAIQSVLSPDIQEQIKASGKTTAEAIGTLVQIQKSFARNPAQVIANLIQQAGIDPRIFISGQNPQGQPTASAYEALNPVLSPLMDEIRQLKEYNNTAILERQEAQYKATETTLSQLQAETTKDGSLKYPHLERVAETMASLIENDPRYAAMDARTQFDTAYHTAVYSDPTIRQELIDAEASRRAEAITTQTQSDRLRAASTVKPRAGSTANPPVPKGFEGAFEAAKKQLGR